MEKNQEHELLLAQADLVNLYKQKAHYLEAENQNLEQQLKILLREMGNCLAKLDFIGGDVQTEAIYNDMRSTMDAYHAPLPANKKPRLVLCQ